MSKVEITNEMIARFRRAAPIYGGLDIDIVAELRKGLDAALNPPPGPEIEVTREMTEMGLRTRYCGSQNVFNQEAHDSMAAVYRAMYAARRKSAPLFCDECGAESPYHSPNCKRTPPMSTTIPHARRKGDI